jgi:hypothetical protein
MHTFFLEEYSHHQNSSKFAINATITNVLEED